MKWLLERFREVSTWRGLLLISSAFGIYHFEEDQRNAIEALAIGLFGASHLPPDKL